MNKTPNKKWFYKWFYTQLLVNKTTMLLIGPIVAIVALPYTFYHWSPNCGIQRKDMPPVQLYLDHFSRLHPVLIRGLYGNFERLLLLTGIDIRASNSH
jgi:hypothetical protein